MGVLRIPVRNGGEMEPDGLLKVRAKSNATADTFGANVAKATTDMGAAVGKVAGLVDKVIETREDEEILKRYTDFMTKLEKRKYSDGDENGQSKGIFKKSSEEIQNGGIDEEADFLRELTEESCAGLSQRAVAKLRGKLTLEGISYKKEIFKRAEEAKKAEDLTATNQATKIAQDKLLSTQPGTPEFGARIEECGALFADRYRKQGWTNEEQIQTQVRNDMSETLKKSCFSGKNFEQRSLFLKELDEDPNLRKHFSEEQITIMRRDFEEDERYRSLSYEIKEIEEKVGEDEEAIFAYIETNPRYKDNPVVRENIRIVYRYQKREAQLAKQKNDKDLTNEKGDQLFNQPESGSE